MRAVLIYWVIGCLIAGLGVGWHHNRCPADDIRLKTVALLAATWPFLGTVSRAAQKDWPAGTCDAKENENGDR
jgi:hypothetical protein